MVIKDITPPQRLILTETLARRLAKDHYKYPEVEKDLAKRRAGYRGEMVLMNYLKQLPQDKYFIFHDLQLEVEGVRFQIDTLLLSQYQILIIEAKNIIGSLTFDNVFKQLIRTNPDGTEEVFEDPRVQAKYHQLLLYRWATKLGVNILPIDYLVFFSNAKTKLLSKQGDKTDFSRVCKGRNLFLKIDALEKTFQKPMISLQKVEEIINLLLSSHSPIPINILNEYHLTIKDILTGVRCPRCSFITTIYHRGKWTCKSCNHSSNETLLEAIHDYFLILKPTITNSELRLFLHLPSMNISQKILKSLNLKFSGSKKNRIYFM